MWLWFSKNQIRIRFSATFKSGLIPNATCAVHTVKSKSDTGHIWAKKSDSGHMQLQCERSLSVNFNTYSTTVVITDTAAQTVSISHIWCLISHIWCLISHIWCLMSHIWCLISHIWCLMSHISCLISHIWYLMSHISCLMSHIWCLMFHISCLMGEKHTQRQTTMHAHIHS